MCGKYLIEIDEKELREIIEAAESPRRPSLPVPSEQEFTLSSADERMDKMSFTFKGGEIFPSSITPVLTIEGARFMTWGFPSISESLNPHTPQGVISSWAYPGIHLINARSETASTSKTFGEAMEAR